MNRAALQLAGVSLAAGLSTACRDLDRFDTGADGAYCGSIVDSEFTRRGYEPGLRLRLTLDVDALDDAPGTLTSEDAQSGPCAPLPRFDRAPLRVTRQVMADPLSLLEFGQSRVYNFVAWVDSSCGESELSIVSLMQDGNVEVRLLSRASADDDDSSGHFGVFPLERDDCEL